MITLYGHGSRSAANILKIRAALAEGGVDYGYVVVDLAKGEQHKPDFVAINPHGKVPVLVDDGFALPESDAILWYVAEKYPSAKLLPAELQHRARVLQWCNFASTSLYSQSYDLYTHTTGAELANRSAFVAQRARGALDRALAVLEKRLSDREFVATDALTIADLAIAAVVHMLRTRSQIDSPAYPRVTAHHERVAQRPAWRKALADTP